MRVLCADDSMIMRKIIRESVDILGFDFVEARSGQEALEKIQELDGEVDLVLLDWNMPEPNGYEVLKWIKSNDRYKQIPVMMVTTEAERENIIKCVQAGARQYITKPFSSEDLTTKIMECLGMG